MNEIATVETPDGSIYEGLLMARIFQDAEPPPKTLDEVKKEALRYKKDLEAQNPSADLEVAVIRRITNGHFEFGKEVLDPGPKLCFERQDFSEDQE